MDLKKEFPVGRRIEMSPHTDQWMMGARFGNIVRVDLATGVVHVKLDKIRRTLKCKPEHILPPKDPTKDHGPLA